MNVREILFRGKRADNGEWLEGSLTVNHYDRAGKLEDEYRIVDIYYGLDDEDFPTYQGGLEETVDPSTVGQYTGLTDKNGKRIFEGDVVVSETDCIPSFMLNLRSANGKGGSHRQHTRQPGAVGEGVGQLKPILFNTEMVRAILEGCKTVTRRVVRGAWPDWNYLGLTNDAAVTAVDRYGEEYPKPVDGLWAEFDDADGPVEFPMVKAQYRPDDILYVRETWALVHDYGYKNRYCFRADEEKIPIERWYPSIHMPKEAARIFLRVTGVRVERLQDMDDNDVRCEGFANPGDFIRLWDSTIKYPYHPRYGWEANPWVWVIEFERCERPERGRE